MRIKDSQYSISRGLTEIQALIAEKSRLALSLQTITCKLAKEITENEIKNLKEKVSTLSSKENANLVLEQTAKLKDLNGKFSQVSMWRLKKKLLTSVTEPPTAKQNKHGDLITVQSRLKSYILTLM